MAVKFFKDQKSVPPEAAIPLAFCGFDVFFVLFFRIKEKHDLLTRNYLHLYQRLNLRYKGFSYLFPQIINVVLCLFAATFFQTDDMNKGSSVLLAILIVTIPLYFVCRWFFLKARPDINPSVDSKSEF